MNRRKKILAATMLFAIFVSCYLYIQSEVGLGNGFQYISGRADDIHIQKNGEVIINSTVVDIDVISQNVVGLRLPAEYLECSGGYKIRLIKKEEYFILDTNTESVAYFYSKSEFNKRLKELDIFNDASLDYTKFESIWSQYSTYYARIDYSDCFHINYN